MGNYELITLTFSQKIIVLIWACWVLVILLVVCFWPLVDEVIRVIVRGYKEK